ncbi:MAG: hypothetical protein SPL42_09440 [Bacteroidales bacterium]|nr:hypothetical protein [Bacteroidales bacterium]
MFRPFEYKDSKAWSRLFGGDFGYCLLLLVVVTVAYSMLLAHPVVHDFFNEFFPQRFFQVNAIRHGIFPLWNPYQSMGMPAHADPQATTFYLPVYLFALFGEYTSLSCGIEFVAHVFVAACGAYFLALRFVKARHVAFLSALCYSLSGFFVGNAQHLSWVIAGAWLPWCILCLLRLLERPGFRASVKLSVVLSLLFSGGYPGFFFVFFYLAVVLVVVEVVACVKSAEYRKLKLITVFLFLFSALFVLLSMPSAISFLEAKSLITRGSALDYSQISRSFPTIYSLIVPYSVTNEPSLFVSDLTMRSLYVGVITVFFAFYGMMKNKDRTMTVLVVFGFFALLVSYGRHLPFHRVVFHALPFFGVIRIPALMRLFFILALSVSAAVGMERLFADGPRRASVLKWGFFLTSVAALASMFIIPLLLGDNSQTAALSDGFRKRLLFDLAFLSVVTLASSVALQFCNLRFNRVLLSALLVCDLVLHVFLSGPITIYNPDLRHRDLADITVDRGWPVPERLYDPVEIVHRHNAFVLWQNAGCFFKEPEWFSYNPFILNNMTSLKDFYKSHRTQLSLPVAYSPSSVLEMEEEDFPPGLLGIDTAFCTNGKMVNHSVSRQAFSPCAVRIDEFKPGSVVVSTVSEGDAPVVLCQSFCDGWTCMMDGVSELEVFQVNGPMMCVVAPEGEHRLVFSYRKPLVTFFLFVQVAVFAISIVFLSIMGLRRERCE